MRVRLYVLLLALIALATLAAPSSHAADVVTLRVTWMGWPRDMFGGIMDRFERENPGIRLEVQAVPFAQIFQTLEVQLRSPSTSPDVYIVDGPNTPSYAARGFLLPLDQYYTKEDLSDYLTAGIDQGTYQGKLYAAPYVSSTQLIWYNKDLFRAAGVTPPPSDPRKPWTYDQVLDAARKLTGPGRWGFLFEQTADPYQILAVPQSMGAEVISPDGLRASGYVNGPKFVEAMTWYQRLFAQWKVSPQGIDDLATSQQYFGTGRIAMLVGEMWNYNVLRQTYPKLNWGVAPHPYFAGGKVVTPTGSWHVGIYPRTRYVEAAVKFVKYVTGPDASKEWFLARGHTPVRKSVYKGLPGIFAQQPWRIAQYQLQNNAVPRPKTPCYLEYYTTLHQAMFDIDQGAPVKRTLDETAARIDEACAKYR
jgi:ABC-type glycerol-3-phosphate transport system substrate-binding protein